MHITSQIKRIVSGLTVLWAKPNWLPVLPENKFDPKADGALLKGFWPKPWLCPTAELVCPNVVPAPSEGDDWNREDDWEFPKFKVEPNAVVAPWAGVEPNIDVDPIAEELPVLKREGEVPEPKVWPDVPKREGVAAGVDPKAEGVVIEPKGEDPNAEVDVVPKVAGFEANGFCCTDDENGFDDVCPNVGVPKGLDGVGAGVDMPKFMPGVDWPAGAGPPEVQRID